MSAATWRALGLKRFASDTPDQHRDVLSTNNPGYIKTLLLTIDAPTGGCVIAAPRYPYWDGHAVRLYNR